ncbi:NAD(P)-binding protein [Desulfovibrio sulfodismutans]|uniref:NAD(P)-binding protein n=1 Tax=Desulfolutivibrio sulfodismutans TaxID=63561 RepID=A0A7K3NGY1_9BACT|nr:FAD-dependent oxidoreductase [Desulfolutivibrio sulfodismutans]NDY55452.1 NAD(P)-binding protein [Desulfolutivibrio sulfodismutans]QLA12842.1 FAD-dependent oxidoreductase [Desulfolutivibrio sulfodismutans DSM 3696]
MPSRRLDSRKPCVLIVGAGLAGLCAAVTLAEAGQRCLLLEREPEAGGLARSLTLDGVTFDYGPHVLFEEDSPGGRLLVDILEDGPVISRRFAFAIQAGGRHFAFPNHFDVLRYPWRYQREILAGLLGPRRPGDDSARGELSAKTGPGLYALLFAGMLRKKSALDGDALHRHWLLRPGRTVHGDLEPLPRQSKLATLFGIITRLRRRYLYPAGGFGQLPDRLLARFTRAGGRSMLGCGPIAFSREADHIRAVTVGGQRIAVDQAIWTGPMDRLQQALGLGGAPAPRFEDILLVFLTYDCPRPPRRPFVYVYHPDPEIIFNRSSYPASIFNGLGPSGREGICLEITPGAVPGHHCIDDLVRRAIADVERLGLHPTARLREKKALLLPSALPVYDLGYAARMTAARRDIRAVGNLLSVGRLGGWHFCMSPEAADQGIKAARAVLAKSCGRRDP